ncbi:response regulator [Spirulina sp. 06S082]|uniref:response regulator n=1 Tax=Spirulina sp. 06S082 TaxID=3110248 RepID=UPI002B2157A2|nr:response regulator [Spirulina sp. 06S082]MEA5468999.1 response regulator [Spirulina sp. 06S082]
MTNRNILLVEDNIAHVRLIKEAFKENGGTHQMMSVNDGVEAIAYLRQERDYTSVPRPDIILLDLNLPKKNGHEVLAEIKADPNLKHIPVLILTSSKREDDILKSYDLHANCYLNKSGNLQQLFEVVRKIEDFWLTTTMLPST